jgi:hypothetical protein
MQASQTAAEIVRRGEELYNRQIKPVVDPANIGKYIAININSGEYEIGDDYMALSRDMQARQPGAELCVLRIGFPTLGRIGGRFAPVAR